MELTQDILLPVLLAAIVANTVILFLVVVAARLSRRGSVGRADTRSAVQASMMSTSYVDRPSHTRWSSNGETAAAIDDAADDDDADPAEADDVEGQAAADPASAWAETEHETDDREPGPEQHADRDPDPEPDTGPATTPAAIDPLTGLPDHAAFTRLVAAEDLRVHRYHRPATVVIFELGGLDRFIDRLGADAADRVVPALADTMGRLARDVDHVARLSAGRFGVLLPETDEVAAINYVERVRRSCELWLESGAIALTLAVGWAGTDGDPTLVEAQRIATDRMYAELRRGARKAADR